MYHFEKFARDSNDPPRREDMRVLVGSIAQDLEDISSLPEVDRLALLNPNSYDAAQAYGRQLREAGAAGILYPSVRHSGGECVAIFSPRAVDLPRQERHLNYQWDGNRVVSYFDYQDDVWIDI